jgi:hypothetical protein
MMTVAALRGRFLTQTKWGHFTPAGRWTQDVDQPSHRLVTLAVDSSWKNAWLGRQVNELGWLSMVLDQIDLNRRGFLGATTAGLMAAGHSGRSAESAPAASALPAPSSKPLRVAAINSIFRLRSHAYHICGRMLYGFPVNGVHHQPQVQLVRMFNHQSPPDDLSQPWCERHQIQQCRSVAEALGGDAGLDVDAVLHIIEHGDYPINERGQILYPRFELFQEIVEVFRKAGRSVPVFVDKHLSYDHAKAAQMMAWSRELGIPLMAGSSLPVTWRRPSVEPERETPFTTGVVAFGYDRSQVEVYLFHALESLQVFWERRRGGETGVRSVQTLIGPAVWEVLNSGQCPRGLLHAAISRCDSSNIGPLEHNVSKPLLTMVNYRDGTRGFVFNLIEQLSEFGFAGVIEGQAAPLSTCLYLPPPPGARFFDALTFQIEQFFVQRRAPYPVERTFLTTTLLDLALQSLQEGGKEIASPALDIRYAPPESSGFFRGPVTELY